MKTIWLIDDDKELAQTIAQSGAGVGWQIDVVAADTKSTPQSDPDLVLLDYALSKNEHDAKRLRENWVATIQQMFPDVPIWVLTFFPNSTTEIWAKSTGLSGVLAKPLVMEQLARILQAPTTGEQTKVPFLDDVLPFREWFDAVETPIYILNQHAQLLTQNRAAQEQVIFVSEQAGAGLAEGRWNVILQKLLGELAASGGEQKHALAWDWNIEKNQWEEWRLHRLRSQVASLSAEKVDEFWLSRTLHTTVSPFNASPLGAKLGLQDYLKGLSELMLKQWGITRLRLYVVEAIVGERKESKTVGWRMIPLAQIGGGFPNGEKSWLCSEFDLAETSHAKDLEEGMPGNLLLRPAPRDNEDVTRKSPIGWGNAGTRVKMMIGETDPHGNNCFLGQLSFDRRTDHLQDEEKLPVIWGPLTEADIQTMQGFLRIVHDDLLVRLRQRSGLRMMRWQKTISNILTTGVSTASTPTQMQPHEQAQQVICTTFDQLLANWNRLQSAPWYEGKPEEIPDDLFHCANQGYELLELYVAEGISDKLMRCEIGARQPVYKMRAHRKSTWHTRWPFEAAWRGNEYEAFVIQDFKKAKDRGNDLISALLSSYQKRGMPEQELDAAKTQYALVSSWIGLKIPRGKDKHWILVAMARGENVWTSSRIEWMHALGKRLATLLRWWNAETEREWFRHALAHELKKPMQNLEADITSWLDQWDERQKNGRRKQAQPVQRVQVENLLALVKFHGHMVEDIQEITGVRFNSLQKQNCGDCTIGQIKKSTAWLLAYHKGEITTNNSDSINEIILDAPMKAATHVFINLLLNAIKFNPKPLSQKVHIEIIEVTDNNTISITIRNAVEQPIPVDRREEMLLPYVKGDPGNAGTSEGMGAGLAVVAALCFNHGMALEISDERASNFEGFWQIFTLTIPIAKGVE